MYENLWSLMMNNTQVDDRKYFCGKVRKESNIFCGCKTCKYQSRKIKWGTCDKCSNKTVLYIKNVINWEWDKEQDVRLCNQHAPRLSNGNNGYKKRTVIERASSHYTAPPESLPKSNLESCFKCAKKIEDTSDFTYQSVLNGDYDASDILITRVIKACDVEELEYYICKNGCDPI